MEFVLDETEVRVLGCLIEKELTTPEYYPLSLNALTNACNQRSNRSPVVAYDETTVFQGLDDLRAKGLARETQSSSSRVPKYSHAFLDRFDLSRKEMALICEFFLRGPQTPGELRTRAGRITPFENLEEVVSILEGFVSHDPPLAVKLPREAGKKEQRYAHLFSGPAEEKPATVPETKGSHGPDIHERINVLEEEVAQLRTEIDELRRNLGTLPSGSDTTT